MFQYSLIRLLLFFPTLFGVTVVIFFLLRIVPGDFAEVLANLDAGPTASAIEEEIQQIRRELGLDKPILRQYLDWLRQLGRGDLGYSYWEQRPVAVMVLERFPRTFELALLTLALVTLCAVPLGVASAAYQNTWIDYLVRLLSITGLSLPIFLSGTLILYVLTLYPQWMPPLDFRAFFDAPLQNLSQIIWPALAQAFYMSAPIVRLTRSQLLDVIREDYVRTARAKGLPERAVLYRHALRNALLPVVTLIGWWGGRLLGGTVIMEAIFGIPGLGLSLIEAVRNRDYPTVQLIVLIMALLFLLLNLLIDLLYAWLDPRIRYR
jgi:peptide/nickel transport system permease protein